MGQGEQLFFAFLAIFLTIVGFLLALIVKRRDTYVMYYGKQGLVLFFFGLGLWIINYLLLEFNFISGNTVGGLFSLLFIILWTVGIVHSLSGQQVAVPVIGTLGEKIKL